MGSEVSSSLSLFKILLALALKDVLKDFLKDFMWRAPSLYRGGGGGGAQIPLFMVCPVLRPFSWEKRNLRN